MSSPAPNEALLRAPAFAWPTAALLGSCWALWSLGFWLGGSGRGDASLAFALCCAAAFAAFTPLHDATHGSFSRRRLLNEAAGNLAALLFAGHFQPFRRMHLAHHRHTNEPERDPDHWSGLGPAALLPLRWATQESRYYRLYLGNWAAWPEGERFGFLLSLLVQAAAAAGLIRSGLGREALLFWLLPGRLAIAALAFFNDYLPHRPHRIPAAVDRYRATHLLVDPWLSPLLQWQNLHLIHHLFPGVPFYRYPRIWRARRRELLELGASELTLL